MISVWTAVEKPYCIPLGGCLGGVDCHYCGKPIATPDADPAPQPDAHGVSITRPAGHRR